MGQIATLDSWSALLRDFLKKSPRNSLQTSLVFLACIMIVSMVVLNLVMAVIVQNALSRAEQDYEVKAKVKKESFEADIADLRDIFNEIDEDGSGTLSKEEYEAALKYSDRVQQKFDILEIPEHERMEIWDLLDTGAPHTIGVDAFADCLRALQGGCKAKDSFTAVRHVTQINQRIAQVSSDLVRKQAFADTVLQECHGVHRQLSGALAEMIDFVEFTGVCIPPGPAKARNTDAIERIRQRMQAKIEQINGSYGE